MMTEKEIEYSKWIEVALFLTNNLTTSLPSDILTLEGMSGLQTRVFLNNLTNREDVRYLEIGMWMGSTFLSALYDRPNGKFVGIDNWSEFDGPDVREGFIERFDKYKNRSSCFFETDCFDQLPAALANERFNVYFYDGGHAFDDHARSLSHYIDVLDDTFVFIVDDWNWKRVRDGTYKSIEESNCVAVQCYEMRTSSQEEEDAYVTNSVTWWNGLCVMVVSKIRK